MNQRTLFLDLEDTVIDDFLKGPAAEPRHTSRVREFIATFQPDTVRIFSFAIYDEKDARAYEQYFQKWLQDLLGVPLDDAASVFRVDDLVRRVRTRYKTHFESVSEYIQTMGKTLGFFQHIDTLDLRDQDIVLIDDAVTSGTRFGWTARNVQATLLNVTELPSS